MKLEPLKQWICDECGEIIEKPEDGWFEWYSKKSVHSNFRIVHHHPSCMYEDNLRKQDIVVANWNLTDAIGTDGLANWLFRIELSEKGEYKIRDLKELVEILRRLHVPYWEEARQYWEQSFKDGFHDKCCFSENDLRSIINEYGK